MSNGEGAKLEGPSMSPQYKVLVHPEDTESPVRFRIIPVTVHGWLSAKKRARWPSNHATSSLLSPGPPAQSIWY